MASGEDLRLPHSLEELLREQVAAAERVLACAGEIGKRLGEAPAASQAALPKSPPLAKRGGAKVAVDDKDTAPSQIPEPDVQIRVHDVESTARSNGGSLTEPLLGGEALAKLEPAGSPPRSPDSHLRERVRASRGVHHHEAHGRPHRKEEQCRRRHWISNEGSRSSSSNEGEPLPLPPAPVSRTPKRRISRKNSGTKNKSLFPDREALKTQVELTINHGSYDVENLYNTAGFWQYLARNNKFKNLTFLVIMLNSLWIAVDTDYNKADIITNSPWEFQVVENVFCSYFAFEIFVRYKAFRKKRDALGDGWFVFDTFLVTIMVWATWLTPLMLLVSTTNPVVNSAFMQNTSVFRVMRLFRMVRVARLARLLKDMPELMILVKGMVSAMRAVFSTLCLLVLIIYIFAIVFTQMLAGSKAAEGCFDSVLQSMNCLLLNGIFADQASIITNMLNTHWMYYILILAYMVIGSLTILNMLIGVMCEVVGMVSEAEKDTLRTQNLKETIGKVLKGVDADDDGDITREEFRALLHNTDAMLALQEVKVDVVQLADVSDIIFEDSESISFSNFIDTILQFRSDNTATVKDLVDCRRLLVAEISAALAEEEEEASD